MQALQPESQLTVSVGTNTAHVVDMLSNMAIPACTSAAAIVKLGNENAAIALAATDGYESVI
jgi:hypothetical protein